MPDAEHLPPSPRRGRWLSRSWRSMALVAAALSLSSATAAAQSLGKPEYVDPCQNTACLDPAPQVRAPRLDEVGDDLNPLLNAGPGSPSHISIRLEWSATALSGEIKEFHLEKNSWGLGWSPVSGISSFTGFNANERVGMAELSLQAPDIPHQFRVRAVDTHGHTSAWAYSGMIGAYDESSGLIYYHPSTSRQWRAPWNTQYMQYRLGGSRKYTSTAGQASFSFQGRYVAWVGTVHPNGGTAEVFLDGIKVQTVSQHHPTISYGRRVLFASPFPQAGQHTLTVRSANGEVDIDAFVVDTG